MQPIIPKGWWVGVDLDGTLAIQDHTQPYDPLRIGAPVSAMVERVKAWLAQDVEVRIFTARVGGQQDPGETSEQVIGSIHTAITAWCHRHIGVPLPITCQKDFYMFELWDDRAVTVERNTGRMLVDGALGQIQQHIKPRIQPACCGTGFQNNLQQEQHR